MPPLAFAQTSVYWPHCLENICVPVFPARLWAAGGSNLDFLLPAWAAAEHSTWPILGALWCLLSKWLDSIPQNSPWFFPDCWCFVALGLSFWRRGSLVQRHHNVTDLTWRLSGPSVFHNCRLDDVCSGPSTMPGRYLTEWFSTEQPWPSGFF